MTSTNCILGIDPGVSGAIAFYFPGHPDVVSSEDVPAVNGKIDAPTLARRIAQIAPDLAVIELVASRPGQGAPATFNFGMAFGVVLGVVGALKIPMHLTTPGTWKKHFRLRGAAGMTPAQVKELSRERALQLWPARSEIFARKRDHNRDEAALLARYGAEVILREAPVPVSQLEQAE